jgi:hypothetical protein
MIRNRRKNNGGLRRTRLKPAREDTAMEPVDLENVLEVVHERDLGGQLVELLGHEVLRALERYQKGGPDGQHPEQHQNDQNHIGGNLPCTASHTLILLLHS